MARKNGLNSVRTVKRKALPKSLPAKTPTLSKTLSDPAKRERAKGIEQEIRVQEKDIDIYRERKLICALTCLAVFVFCAVVIAFKVLVLAFILILVLLGAVCATLMFHNEQKKAEGAMARLQAQLDALKA